MLERTGLIFAPIKRKSWPQQIICAAYDIEDECNYEVVGFTHDLADLRGYA